MNDHPRRFSDYQKVKFSELEEGDYFYLRVDGARHLLQKNIYETWNATDPGSRIIGVFSRRIEPDEEVEYIYDPEIKT